MHRCLLYLNISCTPWIVSNTLKPFRRNISCALLLLLQVNGISPFASATALSHYNLLWSPSHRSYLRICRIQDPSLNTVLTSSMASPSSLYQARSGESTAIHPGQFPWYEVLLARPSMPLLRIFFVNDLSFPILLVVDDRHPRSPICNLHLTIIASNPQRLSLRGGCDNNPYCVFPIVRSGVVMI